MSFAITIKSKYVHKNEYFENLAIRCQYRCPVEGLYISCPFNGKDCCDVTAKDWKKVISITKIDEE